jgi:DNA-binding XRE family transcriptional regulator
LRYSQRALAAEASVSREAISLMERHDDYDPRLSTMRGISRVLGNPHLFCDHCAEAVS